MNKIICDICGTTYPETVDQCPICGSSREFGSENPDYLPTTMPEYIPQSKKKGGAFSAAVKKAQESFYDMDEPDMDLPMDILPEEPFAEDPVETYHSRPRTNYFVIVLLTFLIGVCLLVCGFLFFRFYLPHLLPQETEPEIRETEEYIEETEETTEPTIPCTSIVLTAGVPEISRIGQYWLLHVIVMPENTTDQLSFTSSDESVVTVTEEGRLCAVGEGQTTVVISCGKEQILCQVTVKLPQETEAHSEEAEPMSEDVDETEPATQTTDQTHPADQVVLKLKQTDISFTKKGVTFQLELDCDLDPKDVTWLTLDPDVAICHDGVITVLGNGTTRVVAQYDGQEVYCIVRCSFK